MPLQHHAAQLAQSVTLATLLLLLVWPTACAFPIRGDHRPKTAHSDASAISSAATIWLTDHPRECPTVADLFASGELPQSRNERDPWGGAYRVICEGDHVTVRSAGADHVFGTVDDVIG